MVLVLDAAKGSNAHNNSSPSEAYDDEHDALKATYLAYNALALIQQHMCKQAGWHHVHMLPQQLQRLSNYQGCCP